MRRYGDGGDAVDDGDDGDDSNDVGGIITNASASPSSPPAETEWGGNTFALGVGVADIEENVAHVGGCVGFVDNKHWFS